MLFVLVKTGQFPRSRPLWKGSRARFWVESEVDAWIELQILGGEAA
jgi:predicted DNA-binding transcriptional regulator AlpA